MNTMPVAPEKLLTMFSLKQVAEMVIAFEDAQAGYEPSEMPWAREDKATIPVKAA